MPSPQTADVRLETLDDRLVPSATTLDLTTPDAEGSAAGAIVRQTDAQPTGTGHIRSFVRLQGSAPGGGAEQGYNTAARPLQFDENKSPQFTRELTLGQVPTVFVGGAAYREFLLDINQKSSASRLSLDEVRIYLGGTPDMTGYDAASKQLAGQSAVFDLDAGGDVSVRLDARLNSGSGSGDMLLFVPASAFAGADPNSFVYLYSKMGATAGATANSGFEEWAVRSGGAATNPPPVEFSSLRGNVFIDFDDDGVRDADEGGIAGVRIQLIGTDDLGQTVSLATVTDENGAYSFAGLRPGTYSILETQPPGYADGKDSVGSLGGFLFEDDAEGNDRFYEILVAAAQHGVEYNFGELPIE